MTAYLRSSLTFNSSFEERDNDSSMASAMARLLGLGTGNPGKSNSRGKLTG